MRRIFLGRRFMAALSFLTIFLPMVKEGVKNEELGSSMAFFPAMALLAGVLLWSCAYTFGAAFPPQAAP